MDLRLGNADGLSEWMNAASKRELSGMLRFFLEITGPQELSALSCFANELRERYYGRRVYFRGLIEFSSHCKNDCYYCGLQRSNARAVRYRLAAEEIWDCCARGRKLGFRTFVLQSGEDPYFTDARLCRIVSGIKERFPDCAVTLSVGERTRASYQALFDAGADRYLLRHETADEAHYGKLHPPEQTLENRKKCLYDLKEIGYQVGAGFMADSPCQTYETLAEDFIFLRELAPHMIGIGPFIPHRDTRFAGFCRPSSRHTLILLPLVRVLLPKALLPATTALGTIDGMGREKGLAAGANVLMPNLTPAPRRPEYSLYDHKLNTGWEASEHLPELARHIGSIGFTPDFSRGDHVDCRKGRAKT